MTPQELAHIHALCFTSPRSWSAREIRNLLVSRSVLLCEERGGFLIGRVISDEAEVLTLGVQPDDRRQGIGARLLRDFEDGALQRGAMRFVLEVNVDNQAAIALYDANGYKPAGFRKDYYAAAGSKKSSAIIMVKEQTQT